MSSIKPQQTSKPAQQPKPKPTQQQPVSKPSQSQQPVQPQQPPKST